MIGTSRNIRVWAYPKPCDLRKGYNGLSALVQNELRQDVLGGDFFLFVNRRRTLCKVIHWDGTGLCIYMKRLEQGRFAKLWREASRPTLELTASELSLFLEGCELIGARKLSPPEFKLGA
jgi:transposase